MTTAKSGAYPRLIAYGGALYLFADNKYCVSTDGGATFGSYTTICSVSLDKAPDGSALTNVANAQPLVLPDGRIMVFYRAYSNTTGYSSIRVRISDSTGANYGDPTTILENYDPTGKKAMYEPYAVILSQADGTYTIGVYISCDVCSTSADFNGVTVQSYPEIVVQSGTTSQNILLVKIEADGTGVKNIQPPTVIFRGSEMKNSAGIVRENSRPGMSVIQKLPGGGYLMILENNVETLSKGWSMVVQVSYSLDGYVWTTPQTVFTPGDFGEYSGRWNGESSANYYACGAPYVAVLSDGRIAISFQTNVEFKSETVCLNSYDKQLFVFVSKKSVAYGDALSSGDFVRQNYYPYGEGVFGIWGSVCEIDGKLYILAGIGTSGTTTAILIAWKAVSEIQGETESETESETE